MSTGGDVGSAQALSHELEDGGYLLARHVELLDDLLPPDYGRLARPSREFTRHRKRTRDARLHLFSHLAASPSASFEI